MSCTEYVSLGVELCIRLGESVFIRLCINSDKLEHDCYAMNWFVKSTGRAEGDG